MSGGRKTSTYFPPPQFFTSSPNEPEKRAQDKHLSPQAASCSKESSPKHRFSLDVSPVPLPPTISAGDLDYLSTIAQSDFSEVALVRRRDTNKTIVVKAFSRSSWRSQYLCSAELRVFQGVNSPWIVGFYGLIQDFEEDFLLLEYLSKGNFMQMMSGSPLSETQVKLYAAEMFVAVNSLHQAGIMHRNIQLSNFLVHHSGHLRLCDFGLSYQFQQEPMQQEDDENQGGSKKKGAKPNFHRVTSPVYASAESAVPVSNTKGAKYDKSKLVSECSTSYMAPEVLRLLLPKTIFQLLKRRHGYSFLCDYWSLGVCVYHMLYGILPFPPDNKGCILDKVLDFRHSLAFPMGSGQNVSLEALNLMMELLKKERKRLGRYLGFSEVRQHQFFADVHWDRLGHGKISVPVRQGELSGYIAAASTSWLVVSSSSTSTTRKGSTLVDAVLSDSEDEDWAEAIQKTKQLYDPDLTLPLSCDPSVSTATFTCVVSSQSETVPGQSMTTTQPQSSDQQTTGMSSQANRSHPHIRKSNSKVGSASKRSDSSYLVKLLEWFQSSTSANSVSDGSNPG